MKVFIFGAGASKGSQIKTVHDDVRAPLIDELFSLNYLKYAEEVGMRKSQLQYCREEVKKVNSLEAWLTNRWNNIGSLRQVRTQESERHFFGRVTFYIWKTLLGVSRSYDEENLYYIFLNKLNQKDEPYGLINFNYDLLLDQAIKDVYGATFTSLRDYIEFSYIKPHGSVNWFMRKRSDDPPIGAETHMDTKHRFDLASRHMFRDAPLSIDNIHVVDPTHKDLHITDSIVSALGRDYFYPLVLVPLTTKMYSTITDFHDTIIEKGKEMLGRAEEIYLVGYRAKDDIIKELFMNVKHEVKLNIISDNDPESVAESILTWKPGLTKNLMFSHGFEEFVKAF